MLWRKEKWKVLYKIQVREMECVGAVQDVDGIRIPFRTRSVMCGMNKESGESSTNIRLTTRQKPAHDADKTLSVIRRAFSELTTAQETFQTLVIARLDSP